MAMSAQLRSVLDQLHIESLNQFCTLNVSLLVQDYDEAQLNLLADALRKHLWQKKILPNRLKELHQQHLPITALNLTNNLQHQLETRQITTVTEFLQRDAADQLTARWSVRQRLTVRIRILCLLLLSEAQIEQLEGQLRLDSSSLRVSELSLQYSLQVELDESLPDELLNDLSIFHPWLSEKTPADFCTPLPAIENFLFEDVYHLPIATSRRHEIWAGAQMKARKRLNAITCKAEANSAQNVFIEIYQQIFLQWRHLETLCFAEQIHLPNGRIWLNEILTVRKDFFAPPRSRVRHFIGAIEKSDCNLTGQKALIAATYDLFEMLWLLPDSALRFLRNAGEKIPEDLPAIEEFDIWLDNRPDLQADLADIQTQGIAARNKLVSGYFRSVLKFVRSFAEKEDCPEHYLDLVQEGATGLITAAEKYDYRQQGRFITYATTWIWQTTGRALGELARSIRIPVHRLEQFRQLESAYQTCVDTGLENPPPEILCLELDLLNSKDEAKIRKQLQDGAIVSKRVQDKWDAVASKTKALMEYIELPIPLSAEIPVDLSQPILDDDRESTYYPLAELIYTQTDVLAEKIRQIEYQDLKDLMAEFLTDFPERTRQVISLRYGLKDGKARTLEDVGQHFGLTRERVRQIEAKVARTLKQFISIKLPTSPQPHWPGSLIDYINQKYTYWSKFDAVAPEPEKNWQRLDRHLERLPTLSWHQSKDGFSRKIQLKDIMETLNAPAHYSDITEALNDSFEENVLDDRYVYNILNNNEDFFILLGEGVFSLTSWERTRQARPDPNLLFCPQPLPDLLGQTDTFFESILVAHQSLKMTPLASKFLDFMLKWSRQETTQSNWLKQSILSAYYLVGLIPYIFHFEGEDRALSSTLPNLELSDLRKYCLQKLTERLSAMPEFWWVIQKYHPARPVDLAEHFGEIRPSGLNDVTNRLKILAGLGAIQRLPHGRFRLTPFGIVVANQFARKSEFEDNEDKRDEIDEMDLGALDIGFW